MNEKKQIFINIIWSAIATIISYSIQFIMTPIVTGKLGMEAYGFISLANTFVTYIDMIAVAINAFSARYIALAYHNYKFDEANEYYNSVITANVVLMAILVFPCTILVVNLEKIIKIPIVLEKDVKILFFLVLLNYVINIVIAIFNISAFLKNKTSITSRNRGFTMLVYAGTLSLLLYFFNIKVYFIAASNMIALLVFLILSYHYSKVVTPELHVDLRLFSGKKIKKIVSSGIWNSINNLGGTLNNGLDLIITNQMLNSIAMGQISIAKQLANILTTITVLVVNAFQPKQLEAYAKNKAEELENYLCISMSISGIIGNVIIICFVALGERFLGLWIPGQDIKFIYKLCVITLIGDSLTTVVRPLFYVNTLTDKLKVVCWLTIGFGFINVISMYFCLRYTGIGAYIVVGSTACINIISHIFITPVMAAHFLKINNRKFQIIAVKHFFVAVIISSVAYIISNFLQIRNTWGTFMVLGIGFGIIILALEIALELSKEDQMKMLNILNNKIRREK